MSLAAGEPIPRARLASMLWDKLPDHQARKRLRLALPEMLGAMGPLADELVLADPNHIRLNVNLCWIDVLAVSATEPSDLSELRSDLAALCTGELLEGLDGLSASFDRWLLRERTLFSERLRVLHESELHRLDLSTVDAKQRASIARRLISFDPTHEGASKVLMRALTDMGERAKALREFARCREALRKILDVEPSPETRALYEAIRVVPGRNEQDRKPPDAPLPTGEETHTEPPPSAGGRLRVAVLPFLASGSFNENLAFSLSQEIAAALARFRWFDVIAPVLRGSTTSKSFIRESQLKRKELDYVVDGALSGNGEKLQISVRLLDFAQYARPVWSERFDVAVGQLHQVDGLVTARIVGQIDPIILHIEGQPRRRKHYGATGLLLLAIPLMYSMEREKYEEAGRLINRALQIDPDNAMVSAWAAHWQVYYVGQGWAEDPAQAFATAQKRALRAIKLDPDNAEALGIYAHMCSFLEKDFDTAIRYFDRALRLNPSAASIWAFSALTYTYIGEPEAALQRLDRYRDLAPFDPYFGLFEYAYAIAYVFKRDYKKAVTVGRRVVKANPAFVNGYKPLIAALGHLGRIDAAKPHIKKLLVLEPGFTAERFGQVFPFRRAVDREHYTEGLRLAGIPER
jgi:DNA-binding SARP family transcriptional activator/TolB-like protein/Flp pilus assembly protein TadD